MDVQTGRELTRMKSYESTSSSRVAPTASSPPPRRSGYTPKSTSRKGSSGQRSAMGISSFPIRASSTTAGEIIVGYESGATMSQDAFGRPPTVLTMEKTAFRLAGRIRWHRSGASSPNSTALSVAVVAGTNRTRMARRCTTSILLAQRNQRRRSPLMTAVGLAGTCGRESIGESRDSTDRHDCSVTRS